MLTTEQKQLRRKYLGASDAAAALGLSPYKSPVALAMEKRGEIAEDESIGDSLAVRLGIAMERAIIDAAAEKIGVSVIADEMMIHPNRIMACNFDAIGLENDAGKRFLPLEAKYVEHFEQWGPVEAGLDGVPQQYAVQVVHQIAVSGARRGFLAAYFAGRGRELRIYECCPPAAIIAALEKTLCEWWRRHVIGGERPDQAEPCSLEVLARRIRTPGKTVELDPSLVALWREQDEAAKRYSKAADETKARLLESMHDAEIGTCPMGTLTYREQSRKEYTVAASTFRVARWSAAKGGVA